MRFLPRLPKFTQRISHLGIMRVIHHGVQPLSWGDLYHLLFTLPWPQLLGLLFVAYGGLNLIFAGIYTLGGDCIANAEPGSFRDAFFFSVQTMATIGYGAMYPTTAYSNFWVVIEVFVGLLAVAMATGLMFARFSRPTARVIFSDRLVICPYNGVPTLMLRTANQRGNLILEAQINVVVILPEVTPENHKLRRLYDLNLVRSSTPILSLSWMVMHPIDSPSPLFGMTATDLYECQAQFIVTLTGLDETVGQLIHTRHQYQAQDIDWQAQFVDVLTVLPNGDRKIDYAHFHDTIPLVPVPPAD
ncbi:ion channel [Spirulina major]|uniref:ion channel n=1 Tax=Spirulina major TaxID=270636 RepID=UPI0009327AB9|nr:ion channel [Spirulina major]